MTDEVKNMMLEDSKDLLDNVDVTNLADECQKLKDLEDMIKSADDHLRDLKAQADDVGSRIIPDTKIEEQRPINGFGTISWRILLKIMFL